VRELSDFIAEKKGANVVNGIVSALGTIAMGVVMLGFLFTIGKQLVTGPPWNNTISDLETKGGLILYACILIPLAILIGTVTAIFS
jgi:hypothetical protein